MKQLIFICTGNYFRSRFAEIYFNHIANDFKLNWVAISRGIDISNPRNIGFISQHTTNQLNSLNIPLPNEPNRPTLLNYEDVINANYLIALNKTEHFSFITSNFPVDSGKIAYWDIKDVHEENAVTALNTLKDKIDFLVVTLIGEN